MSRAVIIGIDAYAGEWRLEGAVRDALSFARWLVGRGKLQPADLRLLLAPAVELPPELAGAETRPADNTTILETVTSIVDHPPAEGGRLFFYFSGHGCSAPIRYFDQEPVLIPVDYESPRIHFNRLLPLSMIIPELAKAGVFSEQFFFIDACRDFMPEGLLPGLLTGGGSSTRVYDGPNQYVLYATSPGQKAEERGLGVWTRHLLASLQGAHGALVASPAGGVDDGPCYQVLFRPLAEFVEGQIREEVKRLHPHDWQQRVQVPQYKPGPRPQDPVLATFEPAEVAPLKVSILVDPRSVLPSCRLRVLEFRPGGPRFAPLHDFDPPAERPKVLELPINHYKFEGDAGGYRGSTKPVHLTRSQTVSLELTEVSLPQAPESSPRTDPVTGLDEDDLRAALGRLKGSGGPLAFGVTEAVEEATRSTRGIPGASARRGRGADEASLVLRTADPAARVVLLDAMQQPVGESSGSEKRGVRESRFTGLAPGLFQAELHLPEGRAGGETVLLEAGERGVLEMTADEVEWPDHIHSLLRRLDYNEATGYAYPCDLLGAMARPRLVSLLAFAALAAAADGGGRKARASFARLRRALPLTPFPHMAAGLLVLAGSAVAEPAVGLDAGRFIGRCRCAVLRPGGEGLAVVGRGELRPLGDAEILGAAAEWQLALEETGPLVVELRFADFAAARFAVTALPGYQTVLAAAVEEGGAIEVQQHVLPLAALPDVSRAATCLRILDLAERLAARGDCLAVLDALDAPDLRNGDWLDPIAGTLLGYSLVRMGKAEDLAAAPLLPALLESFPELPDVHVLAGLAYPDERDRRFEAALAGGGLPVFFDGLQALASWASAPPPLLAEALGSGLFSGAAWSSWRAIQPMGGHT
ncbi:MAG TPA: caspase family protein [Thermoanaerobaculia bacterium]|nr:caspase family protein [Thermoanaerobaculia bacterium]